MEPLFASLVTALRDEPDAFPDPAVDYAARITVFADVLSREVYPHMAAGALVHEGDFLTDHGQGHVRNVIKRAAELVFNFGVNITPYETFILLGALYIHDIGNVLGRKSHEQKAANVFQTYCDRLSSDRVEQRLILRVARAHGGKIKGDKDTIGLTLPRHEYILGKKIRLQLLAALLRLADEFADDQSRSSRFLTENGIVPEKGAVFHKYAQALDSVVLQPSERRAELSFTIASADVLRLWGKNEEQRYLLDEIFDRTVKMYDECRYCMRFLRQAPDCNALVPIESVAVRIEVWLDVRAPSLDSPEEVISYTLEQKGYPRSAPEGIHSLCPHLPTGDSFKTLIENRLAEYAADPTRESVYR